MSKEEKKPLMIHRNPNWGAAAGRRSSSSLLADDTTAPTDVTDSAGVHANGLHHSRPAPGASSAAPIVAPSGVEKRAQSASSAKTGKESGSLDQTRKIACGVILGSVILERVAFYGFAGNLVLFLNMNPFRWQSYHAINAALIFFGISYVSSLIGGWLADSVLGRFKTLILSFFIYLAGMLITPFLASHSNADTSSANLTFELPPICASSPANETSMDDIGFLSPLEERCAWLVLLTLVVIAIGSGAYKANICPFAFDQLTGVPSNVSFSFFNWYYWCVNIGSFISLSLLVYFEQQSNFQYGYITCVVALACSGILFLAGRWFYKIGPPHGSVLTNIFQIFRNALRNKRLRKKEKKLNDKISECDNTDSQKLVKSHESISFLDHAKHKYGGMFHNSLVDDVKKLKVILAIFTVTIPYWLVYFQMQTTFMVQGLHMKLGSKTPQDVNTTDSRPLGNNTEHGGSFVVAVAWFTLFDAGTVIVMLPLFDRVIYPKLARMGYRSTFARRITSGMLSALLAMLVAGVVEHFRLQAYWPYSDEPCVARVVHQNIGNTVYNASDMYVYWQIPQYILIGVSEVFTSVACLQFAVSVSPKSMKAVVTGLHFLFMGVGSILGTFLLVSFSASKIWFSSHDYGDINCRMECSTRVKGDERCHLDYYFYLLAGIEMCALLLFLLIVKQFDLNHLEELVQGGKGGDNEGQEGARKKQIQRRGDSTFTSFS